MKKSLALHGNHKLDGGVWALEYRHTHDFHKKA